MANNNSINFLPPDEKARADKFLSQKSPATPTPDYTLPLSSNLAPSVDFSSPVSSSLPASPASGNSLPAPSPSPATPISSVPAPEDLDLDIEGTSKFSPPAFLPPTVPVPPSQPESIFPTSPISSVPTPEPSKPSQPSSLLDLPSDFSSSSPLPPTQPVSAPAPTPLNFSSSPETPLPPLREPVAPLPTSFIPQTSRATIRRSSGTLKVFLWLGFTVFICAIYGGLLLWRLSSARSENASLSSQIQNTEASISQMNDIKTQTQALKDRVTRAQTLLNRHVYSTNLLTFLEYYTLSGTAYSGLEIEPGKDLTLKTTAASYESAARQMKLLYLAKDLATDIKISEVKMKNTGSTSRADFTLTLKLADQVFQFKENIAKPQ